MVLQNCTTTVSHCGRQQLSKQSDVPQHRNGIIGCLEWVAARNFARPAEGLNLTRY